MAFNEHGYVDFRIGVGRPNGPSGAGPHRTSRLLGFQSGYGSRSKLRLVQFVSARVFTGGIGGLSLTLCAPSLLTAQVKAAGAKLPTAVSVPFVGCESDGQVGPLDAPASKHQNVSVTSRAAQRLAFYKAETGFGVLAPRGWYCFGVYGSGGDAIYVSPQPISWSEFFSPNWKGLMGPAVRFGRSYGETSGRFTVAEIIARVFPAHKAFVAGVAALFDEPGSEYPSGPYPQTG